MDMVPDVIESLVQKYPGKRVTFAVPVGAAPSAKFLWLYVSWVVFGVLAATQAPLVDVFDEVSKLVRLNPPDHAEALTVFESLM
jgi:hypothetical protein